MTHRKPTIRKHLLCPACEYDLFGQMCDLRDLRCPECGEPVDVDHALKQLRAKKVRAASAWMILCIAAFFPVVCSTAWCLLSVGPLQLAVLAFTGVIWVCFLSPCVRHCRRVDYTGRVLVMLHISFILAVTGVALIGSTLLLIVPQKPRFSIGMWGINGRWFYLLIASVPLFLCARWLYWRACGLLEDGHDLSLRRSLCAPDAQARRKPRPPTDPD
jgi:hypothetical protein